MRWVNKATYTYLVQWHKLIIIPIHDNTVRLSVFFDTIIFCRKSFAYNSILNFHLYNDYYFFYKLFEMKIIPSLCIVVFYWSYWRVCIYALQCQAKWFSYLIHFSHSKNELLSSKIQITLLGTVWHLRIKSLQRSSHFILQKRILTVWFCGNHMEADINFRSRLWNKQRKIKLNTNNIIEGAELAWPVWTCTSGIRSHQFTSFFNCMHDLVGLTKSLLYNFISQIYFANNFSLACFRKLLNQKMVTSTRWIDIQS